MPRPDPKCEDASMAFLHSFDAMTNTSLLMRHIDAMRVCNNFDALKKELFATVDEGDVRNAIALYPKHGDTIAEFLHHSTDMRHDIRSIAASNLGWPNWFRYTWIRLWMPFRAPFVKW